MWSFSVRRQVRSWPSNSAGRSAGRCPGGAIDGLQSLLVGSDLGVHPGLVGGQLSGTHVGVRDGGGDERVVQVGCGRRGAAGGSAVAQTGGGGELQRSRTTPASVSAPVRTRTPISPAVFSR